MPDLDKLIIDKYIMDVKSIVPYKDAFIMNTSKGKKVLRKSLLSEERIKFIHGAKEHLCNKDFKNVDRYMCTTEGNPSFSSEGHNYTVCDFIEGNECNFDQRSDIVNAARALASLHKASKGFIPPEGSLPRDDLGRLPSYFTRRLDEIKKLRKVAKKGRNKFDYLFLKYVDYFYSLGEDVINVINNSKYNEITIKAKNEGVFCHHDYTYRNIICSENKVSVINFEFCCFELKVYDLANLLRRKMRKCNWDIEEAKIIINEYSSIEKIDTDENEIMLLLLKFPQKFWRVANKYYNSKRSWSEKSFLDKLQEVIDEVEYHKKFIEKFDSLK